jgi:hypothetical protein
MKIVGSRSMSDDKGKDTSQLPADAEDTSSPSASPRDKKTRLTAAEAYPVPGGSSRQLFTAKDLLVAGMLFQNHAQSDRFTSKF